MPIMACWGLHFLWVKWYIWVVSSVTNLSVLFMWCILFCQSDDQQKRTVKKLIYAAKVREFKKLVDGMGGG